MENHSLTHYGILGMKWGVRRYQNKDGSLTAAGKKRAKAKESGRKEDQKSEPAKPKSVKEMSDEELRAKLNRINLEDQYTAAMAKRNPDKYARAKKLVADVAEKAVRDFANKAIENAIKKHFSTPDDDPVTSLKGIDISKLGDKKLQSVLKRASMENALKKLLSDMEKAESTSEKSKAGENFVKEILALPPSKEKD